MAIAAQENPFEGILYLPVDDERYFDEDIVSDEGADIDIDWYGVPMRLSDFTSHDCECEDDEDDAEWLRDQGIIDEDGFVVDSLEFDDFDFEE